MAARPLARRRPDPREPGGRRPPGPRRVAANAPIPASPSTIALAAARGRRGRARDGHPRCGQEPSRRRLGERGYLRLNRDERGGSLRELAGALDEQIAAGARKVVLDNTYLTRAARNDVLEVARRHGIAVRCVWLDTPLAQAQVNLVERLLERFDSLPEPERLQELAKREQGVLLPTSQMRAFRELEPPAADEGFAAVEQVPFERSRPRAGPESSSPLPCWRNPAGSARSSGATARRRTWSTTGAPKATAAASRSLRRGSRPWSPARSRPRSARTPPARRAAGADRRCPAPAHVCPRARCRPVGLAPDRLGTGAPDAREHARRPLRRDRRLERIARSPRSVRTHARSCLARWPTPRRGWRCLCATRGRTCARTSSRA